MKLLTLFLLIPFFAFSQQLPKTKQYKRVDPFSQSMPKLRMGASQGLPNFKVETTDLANASKLDAQRRALQKGEFYKKYLTPSLPNKVNMSGEKGKTQKTFQMAYIYLLDMLEGKKKLSVKEAVFVSEAAYFKGEFQYPQFQEEVAKWVEAYSQAVANSEPTASAKYQALNDLFSVPIKKMQDGREQIIHTPPTYDFEDPFAEHDRSKLFVSKLMLTNSGQCHSLPLLYKILADEVGLEASISYTPNHSFVQFKDETGQFRYFETTNGHEVSKPWMMKSGFVNRNAIVNRLYLDCLTDKQIVANCLIDLAYNYKSLLGVDDFLLICANKALEYHPNSPQALALKYNMMLEIHSWEMKKAGNPKPSEIHKYPELKKQGEFIKEFDDYIRGLGYREVPEVQYLEWLKKSE